MDIVNLFANIPAPLDTEHFETLLQPQGFKLERIVSQGHATPPSDWYDQDHHEWVLVLKGKATLCFEGQEMPIVLQAGDALLIPAHVRHRVAWTDPGDHTIWLALHYHDQDTPTGSDGSDVS